MWSQNGRAFAVYGPQLAEIKRLAVVSETPDREDAFTVIGGMAMDPYPATMAYNGSGGQQLAVTSGDKVAIAYWGGTVRIVQAKGKVLSEQLLPQDVTALVWASGQVVAGLADGRVVALTVKD